MSMIRVKNWKRFQHYRTRRPPWIKLHADLLNNRDWHAITGDDAKLLVELWLVAADLSKDGSIPLSMPDLAFRLRRDSNALAKSVKSLCDTGFLDCASVALADAAPETETETETEGEARKRAHTLPKDWEPTPEHCEQARVAGIDIDIEARSFRAHADASDRKLVRWHSAFTQWLIKAEGFARRDGRVGNTNGKHDPYAGTLLTRAELRAMER